MGSGFLSLVDLMGTVTIGVFAKLSIIEASRHRLSNWEDHQVNRDPKETFGENENGEEASDFWNLSVYNKSLNWESRMLSYRVSEVKRKIYSDKRVG